MIGILFTTFHRTEYALKAIDAAIENLLYPDIGWYIADAGSHPDHFSVVMERLEGQKIIGSHTKGYHPGENWNAGIAKIFEETDVYLRLEDDFVLTRKLEIDRYVRLLRKNEKIGQIRLGLMPKDLEMESYGFDGEIFMHIYRRRQYCYSGHPGLIHKRFHDAYGWFHATLGPGDCELDMDGKVRKDNNGPQVWWPLEMGTWGPWAHIGTQQSYSGGG